MMTFLSQVEAVSAGSQSTASDGSLLGPVVVKIGGSALKSLEQLDKVTDQIVALFSAGKKVIVVHGGGPHISKSMAENGIEPKFVDGLRVTDDATLMVAVCALNQVNRAIVDVLKAKGVGAVGLQGERGLFVAKKMVRQSRQTDLPIAGTTLRLDSMHRVEAPEALDLGWVGDIVAVGSEVLQSYQNEIAVITPIGYDDYGNRYNLNADHAAMAIASAIHSEALVFMSDVPGVMNDPDDSGSVFNELSAARIEVLIGAGIISGGMIPKLRSSVNAIKKGANRVCIVDGREDAALTNLLLFGREIGTTIVA